MSKIKFESPNAVAETLLIALYARALEAEFPEPLVKDDRAAELVNRIDYDFSRFKLQGHDQVTTIMRLRQFDSMTRDFLSRNPEAVVVHIGCGLDTRFERVDNGKVEWYDLDLPEVIEFRQKLMESAPRCHALSCSVFETAWLDVVGVHAGRPHLFLAEGVLPYFDEAMVKDLVLLLKERFPGSELVCDAMKPLMIRLHNLKLVFSKIKARLNWGLKRGRDLERWSPGIRLLSEWFYFNEPQPRLGAFQWMRYFPPIGKSVGIFHYQLGKPDPLTAENRTVEYEA